MSWPFSCPVSLRPKSIFCGLKLASRPMRREKNGSTWFPGSRAKSKKPEPSTKNSRFSGKKSGNRVRFTRRSSTSVSAKSVLTVKLARKPGVTL